MKVRVLLGTLVAMGGAPTAAFGHFVLDKPLSWQEQSVLGDPQKKGPCGDPGTATGAVTDFTAGATVHFELTETIPHGGHYRVALGLKGQADLPADPPVTARAGISVSAPIQNPPQFPVLADGLLVHTDSEISPGKRWTADVKLPAGMTCEKCVLQITQFMTDHGSNTGGNDGFFYHHCAVVNIKAAVTPDAAPAPADAAPPRDTVTPDVAPARDAGLPADTATATGGAPGTGGATATGGTGGAPPPKGDSGGCSVGGADSPPLVLALLLLSAFPARRARRWPGTRPRPDGARASPPATPGRWPRR